MLILPFLFQVLYHSFLFCNLSRLELTKQSVYNENSHRGHSCGIPNFNGNNLDVLIKYNSSFWTEMCKFCHVKETGYYIKSVCDSLPWGLIFQRVSVCIWDSSFADGFSSLREEKNADIEYYVDLKCIVNPKVTLYWLTALLKLTSYSWANSR